MKVLREPDAPPVLFVEPPYQLNHPDTWRFPPEVSGGAILQCMMRRLGWTGYAGKRVLDYGCGVRIARALANLGVGIGQYVGVDIDDGMIGWLAANLTDARFRFAHLDAGNALYRSHGRPMTEIGALGLDGGFDVACMFSVITHQAPDEAAQIFRLLRPLAARLYFTAHLDPDIEAYAEGEPDRPRLYSRYNPDLLATLLADAGWTLEGCFEPSCYQMWAVLAA